MQKCPKCNSDNVHRSRTKTKWENWRKEITGKRPYRCHGCNWRGWAPEIAPTFTNLEREIAERAMAPEPPNLKGTPLMRQDRYPKSVDLNKLDSPPQGRRSDGHD
jgi:hypothetical protein